MKFIENKCNRKILILNRKEFYFERIMQKWRIRYYDLIKYYGYHLEYINSLVNKEKN